MLCHLYCCKWHCSLRFVSWSHRANVNICMYNTGRHWGNTITLGKVWSSKKKKNRKKRLVVGIWRSNHVVFNCPNYHYCKFKSYPQSDKVCLYRSRVIGYTLQTIAFIFTSSKRELSFFLSNGQHLEIICKSIMGLNV